MELFKPYDVVVLTTNLPEHGLTEGMIGTVLECFVNSSRAYEVEFAGDDGRTVAQLALRPDQLTAYEPVQASKLSGKG